ncbi:gamma-glutamylaminecyclotransferase isoform X1 [Amblyraja radiata]|uniref:gamma-glutamylaminecyclotransferase isoform X1 n=2 Tax=Amblyraja radiata TaxID=386614 RepID=UPI001403E4FF|nr:gamma-glutamylaminecyclotransferase isoform X1 [Amblyraja radiata]XP_032878984.1 gamma-glutamylaminecyclotransferase isoform X1 [Amblyraja radiata]XP_032878985.1 gamma-glutamylaminecyclotransferase isoform X1 [Amblyraja radiata]
MLIVQNVLSTIKCFSTHCWQKSDPTVKKFGKMTSVFVYGTLKQGQPNHHYMISGIKGKGKSCGSGVTVEKYPLVVAGKFNIPFLLNEPGSGQLVTGDIYTVDSQLLQFLDEFEGCPEMYQRKQVKIRTVEWKATDKRLYVQPDADGMILCFVYCTSTYDREWLKLPFYSTYDAFGKLGQPKYVIRDYR